MLERNFRIQIFLIIIILKLKVFSHNNPGDAHRGFPPGNDHSQEMKMRTAWAVEKRAMGKTDS